MPRETKTGGNKLGKIAKKMFEPDGKEPYYLGDKPIRNFQELMENLGAFTTEEANWVASWIEYLGDEKTAKKIRKSTGKFKEILRKRHVKLLKYR